MSEYPKKQLQELYENLPKNLQEILFSKKAADDMRDIFYENNVLDETKISLGIKYIGYVFMGILPPQELKQTLKKELELEENAAKQIYWKIVKFVFPPVKKTLEEIYQTEIKVSENPPLSDISPTSSRQTFSQSQQSPQKPVKPKIKDPYREKIVE